MHIVPCHVDTGPVAQIPANASRNADVAVAPDTHLAVAVAEFEVVGGAIVRAVHNKLEFA